MQDDDEGGGGSDDDDDDDDDTNRCSLWVHKLELEYFLSNSCHLNECCIMISLQSIYSTTLPPSPLKKNWKNKSHIQDMYLHYSVSYIYPGTTGGGYTLQHKNVSPML